MRAAGALVVLLLLATAAAPQAVAQVLRVRVVEESSGRALPGALVTLETGDGQVLRRALADETGRVAFELSAAGRFRLQLARIGHRGLRTEPIAVADGEVIDYEARMPVAPVALPDLVVESDDRKRCGVDPDSRMASGILWSEISKALWTFELSAPRPPSLESSSYQKRMNRSGEVIEATSTDWRPADRRPFTAPAEARLLEDGFVTTIGGNRQYHGPDAALLLSEEFAGRYCFAVRAAPGSTRIGLGFRPAPDYDAIGIEGVLWVDRATAYLEELDFTFTDRDRPIAGGRAGGHLVFGRVAGEWIIRSWRITVPVLLTVAGQNFRTGATTARDSIVGYLERGGEARMNEPGAARAGGLAIEGTIYDSIAGGPLAGARVSVTAGSIATTTDSAGRYRLGVAAPGAYLVTVEHPALHGYGIGPLLGSARAERGEVTALALATPAAAAVLAKQCGAGAPPGSGLVVFDLGTRWAEAVEISWPGLRLGAGPQRFGVGEDGVWLVAATDSAGIARICGVPPGVALTVRGRGADGMTALPAAPPRAGIVTTVALSRPE